MTSFTADHVSDHKRLVRGEHYLYARTCLRTRDGIHHAAWNVLMLAGLEAQGEVACIREVMPKARILAVDRDPLAVAAALAAGAHDGAYGELSDVRDRLDGHRFDLLCLDFCGSATEEMTSLVSSCRSMVSTGGVVIVNFSYGRDVVEVALNRARIAAIQPYGGARQPYSDYRVAKHRNYTRLKASGLDDPMIGRIMAFGGLGYLRSIMLYRGASMPMCSLLFSHVKATKELPIGCIRIEAGDFEIAVAHPDPALLYATPQERIEALRRSHAAIKASYTRKAQAEGAA